MHLFIVRDDLAFFAHEHPERAGPGTLPAARSASRGPGRYRIFADVAPKDAGAQVLTRRAFSSSGRRGSAHAADRPPSRSAVSLRSRTEACPRRAHADRDRAAHRSRRRARRATSSRGSARWATCCSSAATARPSRTRIPTTASRGVGEDGRIPFLVRLPTPGATRAGSSSSGQRTRWRRSRSSLERGAAPGRSAEAGGWGSVLARLVRASSRRRGRPLLSGARASPKPARQAVGLLARRPRVVHLQLVQVDDRDDVRVRRGDPRALPSGEIRMPTGAGLLPNLFGNTRVSDARHGVPADRDALDLGPRRDVVDADVAGPRERDDRALAVRRQLDADRKLAGLDRERRP